MTNEKTKMVKNWDKMNKWLKKANENERVFLLSHKWFHQWIWYENHKYLVTCVCYWCVMQRWLYKYLASKWTPSEVLLLCFPYLFLFTFLNYFFFLLPINCYSYSPYCIRVRAAIHFRDKNIICHMQSLDLDPIMYKLVKFLKYKSLYALSIFQM